MDLVKQEATCVADLLSRGKNRFYGILKCITLLAPAIKSKICVMQHFHVLFYFDVYTQENSYVLTSKKNRHAYAEQVKGRKVQGYKRHKVQL